VAARSRCSLGALRGGGRLAGRALAIAGTPTACRGPGREVVAAAYRGPAGCARACASQATATAADGTAGDPDARLRACPSGGRGPSSACQPPASLGKRSEAGPPPTEA
jgi:hypothetical protein